MLVWLDLETTGLDPRIDSVLEVAAVVTDDDLREVARFERVIHHEGIDRLAELRPESEDATFAKAAAGIDVVVARMHTANGLWRAIAESTHLLSDVDGDLAAFLRQYAVKVETLVDSVTGDSVKRVIKPQLAGSTISFDRSFLVEDLPLAHAELHYRNVDVTTLNELARRFWPEVHAACPRKLEIAHRAMADIEESIAVCRHYLSRLAPVVPPGTPRYSLDVMP
jgi:oligoribonuclease